MTASWDDFPVLHTERLELCAITRDHVEWYLEHFSLPEIVLGEGFPPPKDLDAARKEVEEYITGLYEKGLGYRWGLRLKGTSDMIGTIGFHAWDKEHDKAKMGYDLKPGHWGKGLMREALERTVRFGFEEMGLNRIEISVLATNPRSIALATRLGFVREGIMREFSKIDGVYVDEHVFSLLRREWTERREGRGIV